MIKCNINKEKNRIQIKTAGTAMTISTEALALIQQLYRGIKSQNEEAATGFRLSIIASLLDPASPVWEEG